MTHINPNQGPYNFVSSNKTKPDLRQEKSSFTSTAEEYSSRDVFVRSRPKPGSNPNTGKRSALQKHVDFFDYNGDGKIGLTETYRGLRDLGFGNLSSGVIASIINLGLGNITGGGTTTVNTEAIQKGKHEGDSGAFDEDGRFQASNAQLVSKYDTNGDGRLSYPELWKMIRSKNDTRKGLIASSGEWLLLNFIAGKKSQKTGEKSIDQTDINRLYDGSLFYAVADRVAAQRAERDKTLLGRVKGFFTERL